MPTNDEDNLWKQILDRYFHEFMAFFFPYFYGIIDWSKGYEFFDKELNKLRPESEAGERIVDKLVKAYRREDSPRPLWLAIHVEIQGYPDPNFAHRMHVYNYRIYDRYYMKKPTRGGSKLDKVISLAVITEPSESYRPNEYVVREGEFENILRFPMVKLIDYLPHWEELEANPNPFAVVVMAQLEAQKQYTLPEQKAAKLRLVRRLYERKYSKQDIIELFLFIDSLMRLPKELEQEFRDEVEQYEEVQNMPYVSSIEQLGIEKGQQKGAVAITLRLVKRRLGELTPDLEQQINGLSLEQLEELSVAVLDFADRAALEQWLQANISQSNS